MSHLAYFVSDLHLFASRSKAHRYFDAMVELASDAHALILGGDIFDFRWSRFRSSAESVTAAAGWIEGLCSACAPCHVHYVLGNHDYYGPLLDHLNNGLSKHANFSWHPYYVRIGNHVFLHGDVADRPTTVRQLATRRELNRHERPRSQWLQTVYDAAVFFRLHVPLPHLAHRQDIVAERILYYLRDLGQGPETGVTDVYFGHTHIPLTGYKYGGVAFHNSGATIHGVRFQILEAAS